MLDGDAGCCDYIGKLSPCDPLHDILVRRVLGAALKFGCYGSTFEVYRLNKKGSVHLYYDQRTFAKIVAKSCGWKFRTGYPRPQVLRRTAMEQEFNNLLGARSFGLDTPPHRVVRPFATSEQIDYLLFEEYVEGMTFDYFLSRASYHGDSNSLYDGLSDLAWFLADLHDRSQSNELVSRPQPNSHLLRRLSELERLALFPVTQLSEIKSLSRHWHGRDLVVDDRQVSIHGDVTPTQFIYRSEHDLTAIDFEAFCQGDRAADLGAMAAELKHHFYLYKQNVWESEKYISHFYRVYADYAKITGTAFSRLTERARFYMGYTELRICRNDWLDLAYRYRLLEEAQRCLAP